MIALLFSVRHRGLLAGMVTAGAIGVLSGCGATAPTASNATSAAPTPPARVPASQEATKTSSGAETICKREVVIGSYFPIRVCKTAAEWERDSRGIERAQDDIARGVGSATPKQ